MNSCVARRTSAGAATAALLVTVVVGTHVAGARSAAASTQPATATFMSAVPLSSLNPSVATNGWGP